MDPTHELRWHRVSDNISFLNQTHGCGYTSITERMKINTVAKIEPPAFTVTMTLIGAVRLINYTFLISHTDGSFIWLSLFSVSCITISLFD